MRRGDLILGRLINGRGQVAGQVGEKIFMGGGEPSAKVLKGNDLMDERQSRGPLCPAVPARRTAGSTRTTRPHLQPGHTFGHCSFLLPNVGVLVSGDALVTAHPTFNGVGPRLLPSDWSHDQGEAVGSLGALRGLDADKFIRGHGPVWHGPIDDAVDRALEQVRRGNALR